MHNTTTEPGGVDIESGWDAAGQSSENVIAVVDTGVDYNHQDLQSVMWHNPGISGLPGEYGYDFVNDRPDPMPDESEVYENSHGTHCAGVIAAEIGNNEGIAGAATNTKIMALKVGNGENLSFSAILGAYHYMYLAKSSGVNLVASNNSWGGSATSKILETVINRLGKMGVYCIVAAGNNSLDNDVKDTYPSNYDSPYIISVAANTQENKIGLFSNYGKTSVDVAAPGTSILSTVAMPCYLPAFVDKARIGKNEYYNDLTGAVTQSGPVFTIGDLAISDLQKYNMETEQWEGYAALFTSQPGVGYSGGNGLALELPAIQVNDQVRFTITVPGSAILDPGTYYTSIMGSAKTAEGQNTYVAARISQIEGSGHTTDAGVYPEAWNTLMSDGIVCDGSGDIKLQVNLAGFTGGGATDIIFSSLGIGTPTGKYGLMSGTSMATPLVTGIFGLLCTKFPEEDLQCIRARILGGTDLLNTQDQRKVASGGRVNAGLAVGKTTDLNPVPTTIEIYGNQGTLHGNFFLGASLSIDGAPITVQSQTDMEFVFDVSSIAKNQYHEIAVSKNGRTFYLRTAFNDLQNTFQEEEKMPDEANTGCIIASNDRLYYAGTKGEYLYEKDGSQWNRLEDLFGMVSLEDPSSLQFCYADGKIYASYQTEAIPSGLFMTPKFRIFCYDIASNHWTEQLTLIGQESYYYGVYGSYTYNGMLYFIWADQMASYNPQTGEVQTRLPGMPVWTTGLWMQGGQIGNQLVITQPQTVKENTDEWQVCSYLFDGIQWKQGAKSNSITEIDMSIVKNNAGTASGDSIIMTGATLNGYGETVAYNANADRWEALPYSMGASTNLASHAATLGDRLYVTSISQKDPTKDALYSIPVASNLHTITAYAQDGGSVAGAGNYRTGEWVHLTAKAKDGFQFTGWTENGVEIGKEPTVSFRSLQNRTFEAHFEATDSGGQNDNNAKTKDSIRDWIIGLLMLSGAGVALTHRIKKKNN